MIAGFCRCPECGKTFFNRKKLDGHLMDKHGYVVELPPEQEVTTKEEKEAEDGRT